MGFRVIVDCSWNSLPEGGTATLRERIIPFEPLSYDMLRRIEDPKPLLLALEEAGLHKIVFEVLGGVPASYVDLADRWDDVGRSKDKLKAVASACVEEKIRSAIDRCAAGIKQCGGIGGAIDKVYAKFRAQGNSDGRPFVLVTALAEAGVERRPSPDMVLRRVARLVPGVTGLKPVLVPCDAAVALVLRLGLSVQSNTDIDGLAELLKQPLEPREPEE